MAWLVVLPAAIAGYKLKINEIIREDVSPEEQLAGEGSLSTNLLPVLMYLKKRGDDKEVPTKLRTNSLIQLVQNAGDNTFTYETLVDAYENDEAVKALIKNFNRDTVEFKSESELDDEEFGDDEEETGGHEQDPTEVVKSMAHSASDNRA